MLRQFADLHCDTLYRCYEERKSLSHPSLQVRPKHSFQLLQNYAIYIPDHILDSLSYFRAVYDHGRMLLESMPDYCFCKNAGEIRAVLERGLRPCIISIEGGCLFKGSRQGDLLVAKELKEKGVAFLSLCYNSGNALAGGILSPDQGLSEAGKNAALLINEIGISLDISHLNHRSADQALLLLSEGIAATHSNCYSLMPHPRNLTDNQIIALKEKGGLIGMNFYPPFLKNGAASSADVLSHIAHLEALGAEDSIAFGGDFDGIDRTPVDLCSTEDLPAFYQKLKKAVEDRAEKYAFDNVMAYLNRFFN